MSTSVTEKILSSNRFYTDIYLNKTINLAKSITLVNHLEADLYNQYIEMNYSGTNINSADKGSWRYYRHLAGLYHSVDLPIEITSIDNGQQIVLSKESLLVHKQTHKELLKYTLLYKTIVDKYPEQELLIRSLINTSSSLDIATIISKPKFTIISYNNNLIEDNEQDIILQLQLLIDNYKVTKLIQYYSTTDSLFIASQYHILYNFIVTSLLSIRLANAKTLKAHSFHILNYLASHHNLDIHYNNLTKEQALFLYRNLLYIDNHTGRNHIFKTLIDKLFTKRNIAISSYEYNQTNTINLDKNITYFFNQKLLNKTELPIDYKDFTLEDILQKEVDLSPSNYKELNYNIKNIDSFYTNNLYSNFITKDIETMLIDSTDAVKDKLIPTLINYWVYNLKTNNLQYLTTIVDPISNTDIKLNSNDIFKLFVLTLYKVNNISLDYFPDFTITKVLKSDIPTPETLLNYFYNKKYYHKKDIELIINSIPTTSLITTSSQFEDYITKIYKFYIGLWLLESNLSDKDDNGQIENTIKNIHTKDIYSYNDETPNEFLKRIGITELYNYPTNSLETLYTDILNGISNNKISFLFKYKDILKSMREIFKQFVSYTVQLIDKYTLLSPMLVGHKDLRVSVPTDTNSSYHLTNVINTNVEVNYKTSTLDEVDMSDELQVKTIYSSTYNLPITPTINGKVLHKVVVPIYLSNRLINGLEDSRWIVTESTEEQLRFLAIND